MTSIPRLVALADTEGLRAAGITYPETLHAWRWLYRHRHERGLADAFRRIGRRIVVDPERYVELVRQRAAS
jgi:transposase-like protein